MTPRFPLSYTSLLAKCTFLFCLLHVLKAQTLSQIHCDGCGEKYTIGKILDTNFSNVSCETSVFSETIIQDLIYPKCSDQDAVEAALLSISEWYSQYRNYESIVTRWNILIQANSIGKLQSRNSNVAGMGTEKRGCQNGLCAQLLHVGNSSEARPMYALKISAQVKMTLDDELDSSAPKALLITAHQHAREIITSMSLSYAMESVLLTSSATSLQDAIRKDKLEIYAVLVSNPDGMEKTKQNPFWRKTTAQEHGVDLNRNWEYPGSSADTRENDVCEDIYPGPAPFSEPETRAIRDLALSIPNLQVHMDIHSYGAMIFHPWTRNTTDPVPRLDELNILGQKLQYDMSSVNGVNYNYSDRFELLKYYAPGSIVDWMTTINVLSVTIELPPYPTALSLKYHQEAIESFRPFPSEITKRGQELASGISGVVSIMTSRDSLDSNDPMTEDEVLKSNYITSTAIILIVVGSLCLLAAFAGLVVLTLRIKKQKAPVEEIRSDLEGSFELTCLTPKSLAEEDIVNSFSPRSFPSMSLANFLKSP